MIAALVVIPHVAVYRYGTAFGDAFARIFQAPILAADGMEPPPGPGPNERLNVLVVGVDAAPGRTSVLTDTMMVVSFDPVGKTASMVSLREARHGRSTRAPRWHLRTSRASLRSFARSIPS